MTSHSRKYRRRLHALPAALALFVFAALWLYSNTTSADVLLSAKSIDDWNKDCRHCSIEPHYDVIKGEIVRLESRMGRALLSRPFVSEGARPQLSWQWSLDQFDEETSAALMRVTVDFSSAESDQIYRLHYVWNPAERTTHREMIDENEYIWVVSGAKHTARRWYSVERDLKQDLGRLAEDVPEDVTVIRIEAGIGEPDGRKVRSGGYISELTVNYLPEPLSLEPVATSD